MLFRSDFVLPAHRDRILADVYNALQGKNEMALLRIKCEVAGKVVRIEAAAGASVAQDDTILIVESMKMEIPLFAPAAGVVHSILVAEGEDVAEDQQAAILEITP